MLGENYLSFITNHALQLSRAIRLAGFVEPHLLHHVLVGDRYALTLGMKEATHITLQQQLIQISRIDYRLYGRIPLVGRLLYHHIHVASIAQINQPYGIVFSCLLHNNTIQVTILYNRCRVLVIVLLHLHRRCLSWRC